jgi:hypothetical protein
MVKTFLFHFLSIFYKSKIFAMVIKSKLIIYVVKK